MKTELKPEPENACNGFEKICKFLMLEKYNIFIYIYIKKQIPKSPKWCNRKVSYCPEITNLNTNSAQPSVARSQNWLCSGCKRWHTLAPSLVWSF